MRGMVQSVAVRSRAIPPDNPREECQLPISVWHFFLGKTMDVGHEEPDRKQNMRFHRVAGDQRFGLRRQSVILLKGI